MKLLDSAQKLALEIANDPVEGPKLRGLTKAASPHAPIHPEGKPDRNALDVVDDIREIGLQVSVLTQRLQTLHEELSFFRGVEVFRSGMSPQIPLKQIASAVAENYGFSVTQLRSRARPHRLCEARFTYYRLARQQGIPFAAIGAFLNRTHGSVIDALKEHP